MQNGDVTNQIDAASAISLHFGFSWCPVTSYDSIELAIIFRRLGLEIAFTVTNMYMLDP